MIELTKDSFEREVHESKGITVVDFWSQSCMACRALMPNVHAMAERYTGKVKFCTFDVGLGRHIAMAEQVLGLPAVLIYVDGDKKEHLTGEGLNTEQIEGSLSKYL